MNWVNELKPSLKIGLSKYMLKKQRKWSEHSTALYLPNVESLNSNWEIIFNSEFVEKKNWKFNRISNPSRRFIHKYLRVQSYQRAVDVWIFYICLCRNNSQWRFVLFFFLFYHLSQFYLTNQNRKEGRKKCDNLLKSVSLYYCSYNICNSYTIKVRKNKCYFVLLLLIVCVDE
jgi:hypothetical protein